MISRHTIPFILVIILIAALLRILYLDKVPQGINYQESTLGWRAQNLINFGKDEYGRNLPFFFSSWKDIELPQATYITLPFIFFQTNSIFLLRLPFALAGILSVLGVILLTQRLFPEKKNLALWTGFLVAINPWGVWISRIASPEILGFSFFIWGLYFFYRYKKSILNIALCLILLILASLSHKVWLIFIFLFSIYLFISKKKKKITASIIFFTLLVILSLLFSKFGFQSLWENDLAIFKEIDWKNNLDSLRGQNVAAGYPFLGKLFFNKSFFLIKILENFLSYFNIGSIFARGSNPFYGLSNFGPMLITLLPFFIYGLKKAFEEISRYKVLFIIFLFGIIPSIFLSSAFESSRFLVALFPISVLVSLGIVSLNKKYIYPLILLVLFNFSLITFDAIFKEPKRSEIIWNPTTTEIAEFLKYYQGKKVWLTDKIDNNPGPAIAFLNKIPYSYSNLENNQPYRGWVSKLDTLYIGDINQLKENKKEIRYYIFSKGEINKFKCRINHGSIGKEEQKYYVFEDCGSNF